MYAKCPGCGREVVGAGYKDSKSHRYWHRGCYKARHKAKNKRK